MEFGEGFEEDDSPAIVTRAGPPAGAANVSLEAREAEEPTPTTAASTARPEATSTTRRPVLLEAEEGRLATDGPASSYNGPSSSSATAPRNGQGGTYTPALGQSHNAQPEPISLLDDDETPSSHGQLSAGSSGHARPTALFSNRSLPSPSMHTQTNGYSHPHTGTYGGTPTSSAGTPLFSPHTGIPYSPGAFSQMNARYASVVPGASLAAQPGNYYYGQPYHTAPPSYTALNQAVASSSRQQYGSSQAGHVQLSRTSSGVVIDLTEGDEEAGQSSDDDVTITAEKIPLKPPKEELSDDNDDLQVVREKTSEKNAPLCIGQLTGVALILYPIPELRQAPDSPSSPLHVALLRTTPVMKPNGTKDETIKLYSSPAGINFGVVEQRLANVLGPMLTRDNKRGLGIWIEAWVVRTAEKSPYMLPLVMLLFCHPHIVPAISSALEKSVVYLEHPISYDPAMHNGFRYYNPHNTHIAGAEADRRRQQVLSSYNGSGGYQYGRFGSNGQASKSVEVKREQVEEMFKTIQSGADLGEVEPDPMVTTKLYPHQKQALAFLIDRERLRSIPDVKARRSKQSNSENMTKEEEEEMISLWRPARDVFGRFVGWHNVITEVEIGSDKPPPQCRGAILADDMGLGKTIVIISLVANTLDAAREFAKRSVCRERNTEESFDALAVHPSGNKAGAATVQQAQFKSNIPGISGNASLSAASAASNGKSKKKGKITKTQLKREEHESARLKKLVMRSRGTLIVCPLSTVMNWESQIEEHIGLAGGAALTKKATRKADKSGTCTPANGLSVYIYHGTDRNTDIESLANFDVVITTFATLGSEYSKQVKKDLQDEEGSDSSDGGIEEVDAEGNELKAKGKKRKRRKIEGDATSPLQQIEWFRVVLDEAHQIKEHNTIQAHAACELAAERRICLTGTPLQNSLSDLFSLMRFLKLEPFTDKSIWTAYIGTPAKLGDPLGVSRLKLLMRHLALRRTKQSTDKAGRPILSIPPKKEEVRYLTLDKQEEAFYVSHHRRYKHNFEVLEKTDSVLKNYCSILQEVLRLRQICAHMALVRDSEDRALASEGADGDIVAAITKYGLSRPRALRLLALMRDTGAAQCSECNIELASPGLNPAQDDMEEDVKPKVKRTRKARSSKKAENGTVKGDSEDNNVDPSAPCPVLTRCQHLFCLPCFQKNVAVNYPDAVSNNEKVTCSICRDEITPIMDVVQVSATEIDTLNVEEDGKDGTDGKSAKGGKASDRLVEHSTKIRALASDLFVLSQNNPASANYAGDAADLVLCDPDEEFRPKPKEAVKTVVFSQWTSLLDRIEDALSEAKINYTRLDGGMHRTERTKALSTFKSDMSCEVLLVSLRAGGVGLNLTHASRVYMMEPSWNPSVEHQAIDRIHRLGQTRPVKCIRFIVEKSIEANMLEIQERKQKLANMSLGQTLSKSELAQQRREDLRTLFK